MVLPPIASLAEAINLGFSVEEGALIRASIRVRGWLRQRVTSGQSTITATGPSIRLPQRPVMAVSAVTVDGAAVDYTLRAGMVTIGTNAEAQITYTHGFQVGEVPDEIVELVCQVAERLATPTPGPIAAGAQQLTAGPWTIGYGFDSYKAQAGLTAGEKATLRRFWPELPRTVSVGSP